jgi:hypothetical protein
MDPKPQLPGLQQQMANLTVAPEAPGKFIAALKKLYTDNDQKFRTGRYKMLNFKLQDFYEACNTIGIILANYHLIYCNMLAGVGTSSVNNVCALALSLMQLVGRDTGRACRRP